MGAKLVAIFLIAFLALSVRAAELKVGDVAPPIQTSAWLKGEPIQTFEKGKVYVVEFWATWCGSCHAAMPHISELVGKMKGKPVQFVSIADEERPLVEAFMKTKTFDTAVALDSGRKTFKAYGVQVIPHTIVVDTTGKIAAITRPEDVTETALNDVLAGKTINLPIKTNKVADLDWDANLGAKTDSADVLGHAIIQTSDAISGASKMAPDSGRIIGDGVGMLALIQLAYGAEFSNTECSMPNPNRGPYRVSIKAPDGKTETAQQMLQDLLRRTFGFKAEWREAERPMAIVKYDPSKASAGFKKSTAEKSEGFARHGLIKMTRIQASRLVDLIASYGLGKLAVNETGLSGLYDLDITWTPDDKDSFRKAIAEAGFTIVEEKRVTKVLFVEPLKL
jgi:uncharacterized protein (TIGR03435 family)